jgi:hypothetical protein
LGRPGIGTSFLDIQLVTRALAKHKVAFCSQNPTTHLIVDSETGDINPEVLHERVLSAIVEFDTPIERAPDILRTLQEVSHKLETVFSLDIISLADPDGSIPMYKMLEKTSVSPSPNGKNNMGLGRPAFSFLGGTKS